jgi:hypothetical protein
MMNELSVVQFNVALVSRTLRTNCCIQMKKKLRDILCVNMSVRDGEDLARREGW